MRSILSLLLSCWCVTCYGHLLDIEENDVVINEIMADPTPAIGLPEWEYVELYNTSAHEINLRDWILTIGNSKHSFEEDVVVEAYEYLVVCHIDAVEDFRQYGKCHGFPSFKITNGGCELSLINDHDFTISQIFFELDWHSDSHKEDGGWSIEQIDANNPCAGRRNWGSSVCVAGGTPGSINSIKRENIISPEVDYVCLLADNIIEVNFNQKMNAQSLLNIDNFLVIETQSNPTESHISNNNNSVELIFNDNFDENRLYTLSVNNISNCKELTADDEIRIVFGIAEHVETNDIVINEILFNPTSDCVEYLELYNRSEKVIDISELSVGTIRESFPNPADTTLKEICLAGRTILPKSYLLLSIDEDMVKSHYDTDSKCFLDVKSMPSFPNEDGVVIICDKTKSIIDKICYSDKMHYDLLAETQGVALERISFDKSSSDADNWHSASFDVNYGTPGYRNSMMAEVAEDDDTMINISPEIFSPDGDGSNDNCGIYCNFNKEGYSVSIRIFDTRGNMIRELLHNSLVGNKSCFFWDGCDDSKHVVTPGIYIIMTEIFDIEGYMKRMKNVVVVYN